MTVPLLAFLSVVSLVAGCATPDEEANPSVEPILEAPSTPTPGGRIVVGTNAEADGFLPTINRWSPPSFLIARTVFDPLATIDDKGVARPYLAESITSDDTFTTWTIKLRPNIQFHNGEPLTAEALVAHFDAARSSTITKDAISSFRSYTATDELTFTIELKSPWAHLPGLLASQLGYVPAPSQYGPDNQNAATHPVGTGPFRFSNWRQNDRLIVDRNPTYWRKDREGRQLPYLEQVEFQPVPDDTVRSARLRSGDLDIVQTESFKDVSAFQRIAQEDPTGRVRALIDDSQGAESGVVLNTQSGPFADPDLRLAAAYAIDRKALVNELFEGFYQLANGPFTADSKWGTAQNYPTYFPERARQLVDQWKSAEEGRGAPVVKITNLAVADSVPVTQKIAKWWTDAGFDVRVVNEEEKVGTVTLVTGGADAVMLRFWDRPDPDGLYTYFIGDNITKQGEISLNFSRYRSPTVDRALKEARASNDDEYRRQQYQTIWNDFASNLPIIFLFHTRWAFGYQARVHGLGELRLPDGGRAEPVTWGYLYLTGVWVD